jgi:hypothetical protein
MAARRFVRRVLANALNAASTELQWWAENGEPANEGLRKQWLTLVAQRIDDLIESEIDLIQAYAQANPSLTKSQLLTAIRAGSHRDNTA